MNLYAAFKTDTKTENLEGVVLNYGDGQKIRILRAGGSNQKFYEAIRRHSSASGELVRVSPDNADAVLSLAKVYADSIVVGWEGIKDSSGADMSYSKENVIKLLTDLPELFSDIRDAANNAAFFREKIKAELLGKPSDSTSGG